MWGPTLCGCYCTAKHDDGSRACVKTNSGLDCVTFLPCTSGFPFSSASVSAAGPWHTAATILSCIQLRKRHNASQILQSLLELHPSVLPCTALAHSCNGLHRCPNCGARSQVEATLAGAPQLETPAQIQCMLLQAADCICSVCTMFDSFI